MEGPIPHAPHGRGQGRPPAPPRPLIGVNADYIAPKNGTPYARLNAGYIDAIFAAGGLPVLIPPLRKDNLAELDALLDHGRRGRPDRRGGHGPAPQRPGADRRRPADARPPRGRRPLPARQDLRAARCRCSGSALGMQQLNVFAGGTLHLHLPTDNPKAMPHFDQTGAPHRHMVLIEPNTPARRHLRHAGTAGEQHAPPGGEPDRQADAGRGEGPGRRDRGDRDRPTRTGSASACSGTRSATPPVPWTCRSSSASCRPPSGTRTACSPRPEPPKVPRRPIRDLPPDPLRMAISTLIGLSVGSGLEGVDAVARPRRRGRPRPRARGRVAPSASAFPPAVRESRSAPVPTLVPGVAELVRNVADTAVHAARQVLTQAGVSPRDVFAARPPRPGPPGTRTAACPWPEVADRVAEQTGLTVLHGFRSRDRAAGGTGHPITAAADYLLLPDADEDAAARPPRRGRVAAVPARGAKVSAAVGFEAGPGNQLLDALVYHGTRGKESTDPGGKKAVQGRCLDPLLARWLEHPHLTRSRRRRSTPRRSAGASCSPRSTPRGNSKPDSPTCSAPRRTSPPGRSAMRAKRGCRLAHRAAGDCSPAAGCGTGSCGNWSAQQFRGDRTQRAERRGHHSPWRGTRRPRRCSRR